MSISTPRPVGISLLSAFFGFGTFASSLAAIALLFPGSFLEPVWQLNPRGHDGFVKIGALAPPLLLPVSLACAAAAFGLFRGRRWGLRLAVALLLVNLAGDLINASLGNDRRTLVGVPIVALLLWYLASRRVRDFFSTPTKDRLTTRPS